MFKKSFTIAALGATAVSAGLSQGAVVLSFSNSNAANPFNSNNFKYTSPNVVSSVSGSITDAAPYEGTGSATATLTFANPVTGRTLSDRGTLAAAASGTGTASTFNAEGGGFGVGDLGIPGVGRFNGAEAFTITATQDFKLNSLSFAEYTGDEYLNFAFTSGGVAVSTTVLVNASTFTGVAAVFAVTPVDANTPLTITNVSATTASADGRLRFTAANVSLSAVPEPTSLAALALGGLTLLRRRRA